MQSLASMTLTPPLLPYETLARVTRLAKLDGTGVLAIAGAFAVGSAAVGDYSGAAIGVLLAGAGACELHGVSLLHLGQSRGVQWLIGSQLYLLVTVLAYAAWRLTNYDPELMRRLAEPILQSPDAQAKLKEAGATPDDLLAMVRLLYQVGYGAVGVLTLLYQGGMIRYYQRRRAAIEAALAEPAVAE